MEKIELLVSGMSCGHCEKAIVNILLDMGAITATADKDSGRVAADFAEDAPAIEEIKKEIADAGYVI